MLNLQPTDKLFELGGGGRTCAIVPELSVFALPFLLRLWLRVRLVGLIRCPGGVSDVCPDNLWRHVVLLCQHFV